MFPCKIFLFFLHRSFSHKEVVPVFQCSTSDMKTQLLFNFWFRYSSISGLCCSVWSWCLLLYPTVFSKCCILTVFLTWVIVELPGIFFSCVCSSLFPLLPFHVLVAKVLVPVFSDSISHHFLGTLPPPLYCCFCCGMFPGLCFLHGSVLCLPQEVLLSQGHVVFQWSCCRNTHF